MLGFLKAEKDVRPSNKKIDTEHKSGQQAALAQFLPMMNGAAYGIFLFPC
jgi:hypothetical protein